MAALIGVFCGLQNSWKPQAVLEVHFDAAARGPDFGGTPQAVLEVHFDASLLGYPCAYKATDKTSKVGICAGMQVMLPCCCSRHQAVYVLCPGLTLLPVKFLFCIAASVSLTVCVGSSLARLSAAASSSDLSMQATQGERCNTSNLFCSYVRVCVSSYACLCYVSSFLVT